MDTTTILSHIAVTKLFKGRSYLKRFLLLFARELYFSEMISNFSW